MPRSSTTIRLVMAARAAKGHLPGPVPLGYRFNERWEVVPDPDTAPLVRRAFELAAEGTLSLRAILREMTALGLRSRNGRPLGVSGLWTVLTNPFYTGQIRYNGEVLPGVHEEIVTGELYNEAQYKIHTRRRG